MAHPIEGAADAPAPESASDKAADFENFLFDDEQEEADEGEPDEGDFEPEAEQEGDEGEPEEEPAIPVPASLNAEEKKVFAQLPPEAQQAWAASESRRNTQVQEATTKAAERERQATLVAERAEAEAQVHFAAQLKAFADQFRPQMPDPQLAYVDPQRYIAEKAQYDAQLAQFEALEQQVGSVRDTAFGKVSEIDQRARVADLLTVPELANPETRDAHVEWAKTLVTDLGMDPVAFEQNADSGDFRALKKVGEWRDKAAKYDAAMSRKMQQVRSGKRTLRPGAAPTDTTRAASGDRQWQRVKGARSKEEQGQAFADYLGL